MTLLAPTLEAFFTERLIGQRRASLQTVACYRDAFRLLLAFAYERTGTALVPAAAGGPGRSADPRWNSSDPLRRDCGDVRASGTVPSAWPLISSPGIHTRRI
jgi:hypothetical protein